MPSRPVLIGRGLVPHSLNKTHKHSVIDHSETALRTRVRVHTHKSHRFDHHTPSTHTAGTRTRLW